MSKKAVVSTLVAGLLVALVAVGSVSAFQRGGGCGMGPMGKHAAAGYGMPMGMGDRMMPMLRMMEKLNVTDEQRDKIWAVMDKNRSAVREHITEMMQNRKALRAVVEAEPFDATLVRKLADSQGRAKADMIVLRARGRQEIKALLTPEQQAQFKALQERRRGGPL